MQKMQAPIVRTGYPNLNQLIFTNLLKSSLFQMEQPPTLDAETVVIQIGWV